MDESIKNIVVLGIFNTRASLEACVDMLKDEGFRSADVSALFQTGSSSKEFAHVAGTKLPEGTATGANSGAVVGGILGWLAGIGSLAIPGVGSLIAAGPIMATLAGIGIGGSIGGIAGALIGFGIPEYEAKRYEGSVKNGGILLSVHCDNREWSEKAERILKATNAESVACTSESSSDSGSGEKPYPLVGNM